MGDRATAKWAEKSGTAVLLSGGRELDPHLTQCGLVEAYHHTNWHPNPSSRFATIRQRYRQTG